MFQEVCWAWYLGKQKTKRRKTAESSEKYENWRNEKRVELELGTLYVETMTSKSRELAYVMEEERWVHCVSRKLSEKEKAWCIGHGCKLWYNGSYNKRMVWGLC